MSADEEVEEKEFEGSRRLKSSLHIKSKPKIKHQMGTYPRGRKLQMGKNPPASNEAQLLSASQLNGTSLSDVADHIASDEFAVPENQDRAQNGSGAEKGVIKPSEGSVLAPSEAQQASRDEPSAQAESARQFNGNRNGSNGELCLLCMLCSFLPCSCLLCLLRSCLLCSCLLCLLCSCPLAMFAALTT